MICVAVFLLCSSKISSKEIFFMVIYFFFLVSFSVVCVCCQLDRVIFCVFLKSDKELYETMLSAYFPRGLSHTHTQTKFWVYMFYGDIKSVILYKLYILSHNILSTFLHFLKKIIVYNFGKSASTYYWYYNLCGDILFPLCITRTTHTLCLRAVEVNSPKNILYCAFFTLF